MLESKLKYLKNEVSLLENKVVKKIEEYLEDLDIEINIIELKREHGVPKNMKSYEVHFLNKCLTLNAFNKRITYRDLSVNCGDIQISEEFFTKLSIATKKRLSILKMETKLEVLKKIILEEINKEIL